MKERTRLHASIALCAVLAGWACIGGCTPESIEESLTDCQYDEGSGCASLESGCTGSYSEWDDASAALGIKCKCCP